MECLPRGFYGAISNNNFAVKKNLFHMQSSTETMLFFRLVAVKTRLHSAQIDGNFGCPEKQLLPDPKRKKNARKKKNGRTTVQTQWAESIVNSSKGEGQHRLLLQPLILLTCRRHIKGMQQGCLLNSKTLYSVFRGARSNGVWAGGFFFPRSFPARFYWAGSTLVALW